MMRTSDYRARMHPGYWAFAVHRVSGLALALFLPLHFWVLGLALEGEAALDGFLKATENATFKLGEWGLVMLLAVHMMGGVRLLLIEFAPWSGPRKNLIAWAMGCGVAAGLAFALALVG
jgi:fumarate reductase subunit D